MRVNIYAEELTGEVVEVTTTADTGRVQRGVRFFQHSADVLHHTADDDDRSAVTFWLPRAGSRSAFVRALRTAALIAEEEVRE